MEKKAQKNILIFLVNFHIIFFIFHFCLYLVRGRGLCVFFVVHNYTLYILCGWQSTGLGTESVNK